MALLGLILTVTGVLALVITLVRGPNLGLSRRTGYVAGVVLLILGAGLLIYSR
jgi:type IV secretory pathway VirB2 component (pilin)